MSGANWKKPLALAAVLFVLGSVTIWLEYQYKPSVEKTEENEKKPLQLAETPIVSIKLKDGKENEFQFRCLDLEAKLCKPSDISKWEITKPVRLNGDKSNVNSLVSALQSLTADEVFDLSEEKEEKRVRLIQEYGLSETDRNDPASRRVEIETEKGKQILFLGADHPIGNKIFGAVERDGKFDSSEVFLLPGYFKSNLEKKLTYWRDKTIFTLESSGVNSFEVVSTSNGTLSFVRDGADWTVQERAKGKTRTVTGDQDSVSGYLDSILKVKAVEFVSEKNTDAKSRAALSRAKKIYKVTLAPNSGKKVNFEVFEEKEKSGASKLYLKASHLDPLFELAGAAKNKFDKQLKDLRVSRLISSLDRFSIQELKISKAGSEKPITVTKNDSSWRLLADGKESEASKKKIENFLDRVSSKVIKEYLKSTAVKETKDMLDVKLMASDNKSWNFTFWKKDGKVYAKNPGAREVYLLDAAMEKVMFWGLEDLKN